MKRDDIKVLRYLAKHDTGEYIDVAKHLKDVFYSKERAMDIYRDLGKKVDVESVYEYRGVLFLNEIDSCPSVPILKSKINQVGREYLEKYEQEKFNLSLRSSALLFAAIGLIITLIQLILVLLQGK